MVVAEGELDVDRFERGVVAARDLPAAERAEALRTALGVWRGLPLVDALMSPTTQSVIVQLEARRLEAVESRFEAELAVGVDAELVAELEGLVVLHPFREQFWRLLMLALYRSGRQADALGTYRRVHRIFASELGLEPSDSLKELQRRILVGDAEPERPRQADDVLLRATLLLPAERNTRARALVEYGTALRRLGEIERADVVLAEAKRLGWESGSDAAREHVALALANVRVFDDAAPLRDVLSEARRAVIVFGRAGDHAARAAALRTEGQMLRDLGRAREAAAALEASIEAALAAGSPWEEGMSRNFVATAHLYGPTPVVEGIAICERELAALEWGPPGPIGLWGSLGSLLAMSGDVAAGRPLATRAVAATRSASTPGTHCWALWTLAGIDELVGDVESATAAHRAVVEVLDALGNEGALALHSAELARMIALDEPDEAEALALRTRARAASDDFSSQVAWRRALARTRPRAEGLRFLEEAVALTMASDCLDLRGRTLEDLAALQPTEWGRRTLRRAQRAFRSKGNVLALARVGRALDSLPR
jgi:tetratricopeptide (TPR) repeat protein